MLPLAQDIWARGPARTTLGGAAAACTSCCEDTCSQQREQGVRTAQNKAAGRTFRGGGAVQQARAAAPRGRCRVARWAAEARRRWRGRPARCAGACLRLR